MPYISRHPEGQQCQKARCHYCHPTKKKSRVHTEIAITLDMKAIEKEFGITETHFMDAKRWIDSDLREAIAQLPYAQHIIHLQMLVHGKLEK